jgi:hypothetical protein
MIKGGGQMASSVGGYYNSGSNGWGTPAAKTTSDGGGKSLNYGSGEIPGFNSNGTSNSNASGGGNLGISGNYFTNKWDGGTIPGEAEHPGDHPENDTVDAKLSPGEIIIPRSKAKDPKEAAKFAAKEASKNSNKKKVMNSLSDLLKHLNEIEE